MEMLEIHIKSSDSNKKINSLEGGVLTPDLHRVKCE